MIEIVLKFEIEDGDGAAMMKVMALSEEDGSFLMSVTGKSARTANTITPAARELVVETDLVTAKEAAALIGRTAGGIQWAARNGKLEKVKQGKNVLYRRADILAYKTAKRSAKNSVILTPPKRLNLDGTKREFRPTGHSPWTMTPKQAADRVGVTENAIRDAVKAEKVSGKKIDGKLMIHPTSLGAYKRKRESLAEHRHSRRHG